MKLKRITPRTCLWPLTGSILLCFGLSLALTFRSNHHCYAAVCGEWLFPIQARLHIVVWYCWLSVSAMIMALRALRPSIQLLFQREIIDRQLPFLGKRLTVGGASMILSILILYGIVTGLWWPRLQEYFATRGRQGNLSSGNNDLAAVALTGHMADVTMGMILLPVSRHSALASFFRLSASTTFAFHMVQAYVLFALVVVHGIVYASWTSIYHKTPKLTGSVFPLLNPTYIYSEVWPGNDSLLGLWRASLIFTGIITILIMLAIFITTLPAVRRNHFNLFYFTHLLSIVAVVIVCLHASTMFYCTAPGLVMYVLDWGMRIYELSGRMDGQLEAIGNGWFSLTLPLPRRRLDGCACHSPLAHFHIHHTKSSIREIHPFTSITHLASQKLAVPSCTSRKLIVPSSARESTIPVQFLFRKREATRGPKEAKNHEADEKLSKQWTNKLASLVENPSVDLQSPIQDMVDAESQYKRQRPAPVFTSLRLEGPYFTPADPAQYSTVVCIVAGTGVSGAIAIAAAFSAQSCNSDSQRSTVWKRCVIVWSIRECDYIQLPFIQDTLGLEVKAHLTGEGRCRLDTKQSIKDICLTESIKSTWVYISGPNPFIEATEKACRDLGVAYFGARWT